MSKITQKLSPNRTKKWRFVTYLIIVLQFHWVRHKKLFQFILIVCNYLFWFLAKAATGSYTPYVQCCCHHGLQFSIEYFVGRWEWNIQAIQAMPCFTINYISIYSIFDYKNKIFKTNYIKKLIYLSIRESLH